MADGIRRLAGVVLMSLGLSLILTGCGDQPAATGAGEAPHAPGVSTDGAAFAPLVAANGPAVVNISTTRTAQGEGAALPERFRGTPFEEFFERFFGAPDQPRESQSLGSGFVVGSDGYIVTNAHVVAGASEVVVRLSDRRQLQAEVVGKDKATDLALLKVAADGLPTVAFAQPDSIEVGEWVVAMGAPFGFENSVTAGIVSAKGRSLPGDPGSYVPFLQTDVAINPGSSGGPLFNLDGKVVGVNAQIYSKSGGYMGLSFAIPAAVAQDVIAQLKADGKVRHGWLGVAIQDVNRQLAEALGMDQPRGGVITRVVAPSPAAEAGLATGDVIVAVDGETVGTAADIPPLVGRKKPGESLTLTVLREGQRLNRQVTLGALGERPQAG